MSSYSGGVTANCSGRSACAASRRRFRRDGAAAAVAARRRFPDAGGPRGTRSPAPPAAPPAPPRRRKAATGPRRRRAACRTGGNATSRASFRVRRHNASNCLFSTAVNPIFSPARAPAATSTSCRHSEFDPCFAARRFRPASGTRDMSHQAFQSGGVPASSRCIAHWAKASVQSTSRSSG